MAGKPGKSPPLTKMNPALQPAAESIKRLQHDIIELKSLGQKLGGAADDEAFRKKLKESRATTKASCNKINSELTAALRVKGINKAQVSKLRRDFEALLRQLTKLNEETIKKERRISRQMAKKTAPLEESGGGGGMFGGGSKGLEQLGELKQLPDDTDVAILQERQAELNRVEREAIEVKELFVDVQSMVGQQGEMLAGIEDNVVTSGAKVESGTAHLGDALKYQQAYRKKMCCCAVFGLILILIITLWILSSTGVI